MEGWLYGLFALLGVLVGSGFSYLGIKMNLTQQNKIDSRQWRRKVRGEPLLKFRDELATIATKLHAFSFVVTSYATKLAEGKPLAEMRGTVEYLEETISDVDAYLKGSNFLHTLFTQSDKQIIDSAKQIVETYSKSVPFAKDLKNIKVDELEEAKELLKQNSLRITEVQELINKRLEEL